MLRRRRRRGRAAGDPGRRPVASVAQPGRSRRTCRRPAPLLPARTATRPRTRAASGRSRASPRGRPGRTDPGPARRDPRRAGPRADHHRDQPHSRARAQDGPPLRHRRDRGPADRRRPPGPAGPARPAPGLAAAAVGRRDPQHRAAACRAARPRLPGQPAHPAPAHRPAPPGRRRPRAPASTRGEEGGQLDPHPARRPRRRRPRRARPDHRPLRRTPNDPRPGPRLRGHALPPPRRAPRSLGQPGRGQPGQRAARLQQGTPQGLGRRHRRPHRAPTAPARSKATSTGSFCGIRIVKSALPGLGGHRRSGGWWRWLEGRVAGASARPAWGCRRAGPAACRGRRCRRRRRPARPR